MNLLLEYLVPTLFIIVPIFWFYNHQKSIWEKNALDNNGTSLKQIIEERYILSSDLISEFTEQNLMENSVIISLIDLRSSSMNIKESKMKLVVEDRISKSYRSIISHLRMMDLINPNCFLFRLIQQWERLDKSYEKQKGTESDSSNNIALNDRSLSQRLNSKNVRSLVQGY